MQTFFSQSETRQCNVNLLRIVLATALYAPLCVSEDNSVSSLLSALNIVDTDAVQISMVGPHTKIEYTLDESCSQKMNDLLQHNELDPYIDWDSYRHIAQKALLSALPADLKNILMHMRTLNKPTMLIVHNMPVDNFVPETPRNGERPAKNTKGSVSESVLLGVCNFLNCYPDFDEKEKDGTYINQIIPVDDAKNKQAASSLGSEVTFEFHTENVYEEIPLKYLSLLCLRGDPKVATSVVFLESIFEGMKQNPHPTMSFEEVISEMEKPQFSMKSGPSFREGKRETLLPILCFNKQGERIYRFNANKDRVEGSNEKAQAVVEYLKSILTSQEFKNQYSHRIHLKKGDYLLINNWEVMHARDAFKIDPANWRWLQRCYLTRNEEINL